MEPHTHSRAIGERERDVRIRFDPNPMLNFNHYFHIFLCPFDFVPFRWMCVASLDLHSESWRAKKKRIDFQWPSQHAKAAHIMCVCVWNILHCNVFLCGKTWNGWLNVIFGWSTFSFAWMPNGLRLMIVCMCVLSSKFHLEAAKNAIVLLERSKAHAK